MLMSKNLASLNRSNNASAEFTAKLRYFVLVAWVALCAFPSWVCFTDKDPSARFFSGTMVLLFAGVLIFHLSQESPLASNHLLAEGEVVIYRRRGRGGSYLHYRFRAL